MPSRVNEVVTQLLTRVGAMKRCGDEPSRLVGQVECEQHVHVALDGKTLRGTLSHEAADQRKMHQLALYETGTGLLLKEQVVGDKENELSIVSQFLSPVWVKGRIISADALHTQHTALALTSRTAGATSCLSLRAISRRCAMICTSFSVSRPLIARIGGRRAPSTKDMDDWKSANWWKASN
jgi:hypothetical protein